MRKINKLATLFTGTAVVIMMTGTSAFADSRHRAETRDGQQTEQRSTTTRTTTVDRQSYRNGRTSGTTNPRWDRSQTVTPAPAQTQRFDRSYNNGDRSYNNNRSYNNSNNSNRSYSYNQSRSYDRGVNNSYRPYSGSTWSRGPIRNEARFYSGRVQRYEPFAGGFRVWIGGAPAPFFISANMWHRYGIRVGAVVGLGGYWDPLGYYNVYNVGAYGYGTAGDIHGVVESVDYRVGTAVIRDDVSGAFVTALLRGSDPRLGQLRQGDYVDLTGSWNRSGVFDALSVNDLRYGNGGGYGYDQPQPGYGQPGY